MDEVINLNLQYCEKCQIHYFPDFDNNTLPTTCVKCGNTLIDAGFNYEEYKQLPKSKKCNNCKRKYPKRFVKCPRCYAQLVKTSSSNQKEKANLKNGTYIPKCPTCQSPNIKKISNLSKAGSVAMWGIFSQKVRKQWHCNNCGSEW